MAVGRLLHGDGTVQGLDRRREGGHEPVAGVLDLLPLVGRQCFPQVGEVGAPQPVVGNVAEPGHQLGRPHEIGEEHRRRPAGTIFGIHGWRGPSPLAVSQVTTFVVKVGIDS